MTYPTRFIVLCHARTGSTLFGSLLASHPAIDYRGEEFDRYPYWRGIKILVRFVVRRYPLLRLNWMAWRSPRSVFGCKMTPYYVRNVGRVVAQVHEQGWLIVYLHRRNLFSEAISGIVARKTTRYMRVEGKPLEGPDDPKLRIGPSDLLAQIEQRCRWIEAERAALAKIPYVDVVYEDDLADPAGWEAATGRVFDALGLERTPPQTRVMKTWDRPYSEIVVNYAELVETVRTSNYARFLEDAA